MPSRYFSSNILKWNLPLEWTFLSLILKFSCKNFGHSATWKTLQLYRVILLNWSYSITPFFKWWFCPPIVLHCLHDPLGLLLHLPSFTAEFQRKAHYYLHTFVFSSSTSYIALFRSLPTFLYYFSCLLRVGVYEKSHQPRFCSTEKFWVFCSYFSAQYYISHN